jgi:RNA polymerase sigma-70 factor (ECF subfamily)
MLAAIADPVTVQILAEEERLRRLARQLVRCEADVEDLVQDALLKAFRARNRFAPGTSIRAWTSTILRRVFLTGAIRSKRRGLCTDTDAGEPLERTAGTAVSSFESEPELERILQNVDDAVRRALLLVPEIYRTPFLLSAVDGLSCADIAERLDVPEGTVMSRIHRARERMKRDLVYDRCPSRTTPARR